MSAVDDWKKVLANRPQGDCLKNGISGYLEDTLKSSIGSPDPREDGTYILVSESCGRESCNFCAEFFVEVKSGKIVNFKMDEIGKCRRERFK
jgi:hypothetical protein